MAETKSKKRKAESNENWEIVSFDELKERTKRDSMIDQIGQQSLQTALVPAETQPAQEQTLTDKQTSIALAKKRDVGRPTNYSIELASHICELIADGNPLRRITRMDGMPRSSTVYEWLASHKEFTEMYTRAREDQADALADEIVEIADEQPDLIEVYDKDGKLVEVKVDTALLAWQKNRIDARKWTAAKLKPRKYGERQIIEGDENNPITLTQRSETIDIFMQNILLIKQSGGK